MSWLSYVLVGLVRLFVGASARFVGTEPFTGQAIYFANHSSHIDTIALWSALPHAERIKTRPVAAKDYWGGNPLRRYIARKGLNAKLIDRLHEQQGSDPLAPLLEALKQGNSLIIFPEGTRHAERLPASFKSGLYRLSLAFPDVALIPVYLENLHRSMPKGSWIPIPMICSVRFGPPLAHLEGENKEQFLIRARQSVINLS
jgi:1-acyl-sn-glycerol-3-phosphate acyltransferase